MRRNSKRSEKGLTDYEENKTQPIECLDRTERTNRACWHVVESIDPRTAHDGIDRTEREGRRCERPSDSMTREHTQRVREIGDEGTRTVGQRGEIRRCREDKEAQLRRSEGLLSN